MRRRSRSIPSVSFDAPTRSNSSSLRERTPAGVEAGLVARVAAALVEQHADVDVGVRDQRLDLDRGRTKRLGGIDMPRERARDREEPVEDDWRDAVGLLHAGLRYA